MKFIWKIWLRVNRQNRHASNDYTAEVSTARSTKNNVDIAQRIIKENAEGACMDVLAVLDILNKRDQEVCKIVQEGNSVLSGCTYITPRVNGIWSDSGKDVYRVSVDMLPSVEMREALTKVEVKIMGKKSVGPHISQVIDILTGRCDGTISPNENILIEGEYLSVAPKEEPGIGVFLVNSQGESREVVSRLIHNYPKKIIARVPNLDKGTYQLRVISRGSTNKRLLKEPRLIEYPYPLTVK